MDNNTKYKVPCWQEDFFPIIMLEMIKSCLLRLRQRSGTKGAALLVATLTTVTPTGYVVVFAFYHDIILQLIHDDMARRGMFFVSMLLCPAMVASSVQLIVATLRKTPLSMLPWLIVDPIFALNSLALAAWMFFQYDDINWEEYKWTIYVMAYTIMCVLVHFMCMWIGLLHFIELMVQEKKKSLKMKRGKVLHDLLKDGENASDYRMYDCPSTVHTNDNLSNDPHEYESIPGSLASFKGTIQPLIKSTDLCPFEILDLCPIDTPPRIQVHVIDVYHGRNGVNTITWRRDM